MDFLLTMTHLAPSTRVGVNWAIGHWNTPITRPNLYWFVYPVLVENKKIVHFLLILNWLSHWELWRHHFSEYPSLWKCCFSMIKVKKNSHLSIDLSMLTPFCIFLVVSTVRNNSTIWQFGDPDSFEQSYSRKLIISKSRIALIPLKTLFCGIINSIIIIDWYISSIP